MALVEFVHSQGSGGESIPLLLKVMLMLGFAELCTLKEHNKPAELLEPVQDVCTPTIYE
jgi:hypothetical protein